jgi:hypothetical protein
MKLVAALARSLQADMQVELRNVEREVTTGTRGLKTELRRHVTSAALGQRLANSWRDRHYPNQKLDAAGLVYTKARQIIRAFDEGAVIRSRRTLSRDPDRERAEESDRQQTDQPAHVSRASVRSAPVRASIQRTVTPCGGWTSGFTQPQEPAAAGLRRATDRAENGTTV